MANNAISFFGRTPNDMAQFFSMASDSFDGKAENVVTKTLEEAEDRMLAIIDNGGINKTAKGGARIDSGDMRAAVIGAEDVGSSGGRVTGRFGFGDDAPFYTKFQEKGTGSTGPARSSNGGSGIPAMLAYAEAQAVAITKFQDLMFTTHWVAASKI